jgi:hypothetical protein
MYVCMCGYREGKEDAPNFLAEDGTTNSASCVERQTDEGSDKIEYKNKGTVAVAHSLRWKEGSQLARMDQRRWTDAVSVWDIRKGERRSGRPKTLWADTFWKEAGGQ